MSETDNKPRPRIVTCQFNADPHPIDNECQNITDVTEQETRRKTLIEAYWKLRDHAAGYRDADLFKKRQARWEGDRNNSEYYHQYMIHEFYARGLEWAARDIAEMLGVTEPEIERE